MSYYPTRQLCNVGVTLLDCEHRTPKASPVGYPYVAIPNIKKGRLDLSEVRLISKEDFESWTKKTKPQAGDIIVTRRARVGDTAVVPLGLDCAIGQNLVILRSDGSKLDQSYLRWALQGPIYEEQVRKFMNVGAVFDRLNCADIPKFEIPVPPLPEQRAIARILGSLDNKIELNHRQNKTLEAMAEAIFRQWFIEEADDGWEETTIENVCVRIASGGTPSTKVGEYYNGDINWYSTRELSDTFLYESSTKITNSGLENSSAKMFPENTVLIAICAAPTVGRLGILANDATFNQSACGFIADENKICFEYLYLHLLFSRQKLNNIASGSAQQNLNVKIIKNFEILLPPSNIVQKLKCVVRPIFQQIKLNTKQIMTLEKLRDTLLPKLMSGDVRVDYS